MASSLNRIFTTKKLMNPPAYEYEAEQEEDFAGFSSGSETESISERDSGEDDESCSGVGRKRRGGVAPAPRGDDGKVQRNPTRRPNPKISNRNALLARENRRRKKEHVESLEKEVDELKECNGKIRKALRKKSKLVEQLTRERNYLKSVIANRTGIMAILKSVQRAGFPMTSSGLSYVTEPIGAQVHRRIGSSSDEGMGSSPHSMLTDEEDHKFNPHDLGMAGQEVPFEEEFSRLPDVDELLSTMAGEHRTSGEQVPQPRREFASTSSRGDASRWSFALPVR